MTCKDCMYYFLCANSLTDNYIENMLEKSVDDNCIYFKDKSKIIELPCKVGDTVYVVTTCEHVIMSCDNDYFTGTGAITCPFERDCDCEECNDNNKGIFETHVSNIHCDEDGVGLFLELDNLLSWGIGWSVKNVGKTIFFTRKEAEKALEGMQKWKI